jgi:hypothetical protein
MGIKAAAILVIAAALAGCEAPTVLECREANKGGQIATSLWRACLPVLAEDGKIAAEAQRAANTEAQARMSAEREAAAEKLKATERRKTTRKFNPDQSLLFSLDGKLNETSQMLRAMRMATTCGVRSNNWFGRLSFIMNAQSAQFYSDLRARVVDKEIFEIDARELEQKHEIASRPPFPTIEDCYAWLAGDNRLFELDTILARAMGRGY